MSYVKHFSRQFSKEKSYEIIQQLATVIQEAYGLPPADTNPWPGGSGPCLYELSYSTETEPHALGKRQYNALFEKNLGIDVVSAEERRKASFDKWLAAEEQCRLTNRKFEFDAPGHSPERNTLIFLVSRKIASILGPAPSLADLDFGFGPGANVGCTRLTSARRKLSAKPTCSTKAAAYLSSLQNLFPFWPLQRCSVEKGKLTFVAKNALTDRSIVIEPIVNTFVQKGIGNYIRSRLRRAGVDLNSQQTNRDFARFGSLTDLISTIDLSSASDTVAKQLVSLLLPYEWVSLLDGFRTPTVSYLGKDYTLHKWSSMGNGYTFELESLIFFAIASVVSNGSRFVNAYGDDLIVPSRYAPDVIDALEFFGFTVNEQKSYITGRFRESCGKDFLDGVDVRPCYVKERLSYKELFRLHNFFVRRYEYDIAKSILRYIPVTLRRYVGPDGCGDGHLIGDWTRVRKNRQNGWGGYSFKTIVARPFERKDETSMDYAAFLYLATGARITSSTVLGKGSQGYASAEIDVNRQSLRRSPFDSDSFGDILDPLDNIPSKSMYIERSPNRFWTSKSVYTLSPLG